MEQLLPDRRRALDRFEDPCVQLLVDARHAGHHRRPDQLHVRGDGVERLGKRNRHASPEVEIVDQPFERVAQREKGERNVLFVQDDDASRINHVARDVPMREHDPLRFAGRSGRVDDGCQLIRLDGERRFLVAESDAVAGYQVLVAPLRQFLQAQRHPSGPAVAACLSRGRVHYDERAQTGQIVPNGTYLRRLFFVRRHYYRRVRIGQDVADLGRGQGRIDRYGDASRRQDGKVGDHPLGPAVGQDRDPVACLHPERAQAEALVPHLVEELLRREHSCRVTAALADQGILRMAPVNVEGQLGNRADCIVHGSYSPRRWQPVVKPRVTRL